MTRHFPVLILLALLSLCRADAMEADKLIDLPRGTVEGHLDNGLHYILMPNALPRHGIEMRLVMRVGSLQETDRQQGGAHFIEHMAFAGTRHFPGNSWVDYFERLGMKYGRDINAFTGFDRTIYWLSLPVADFGHEVMDTTLLALSDVLGGITFDELRMDKERGVIQEELRGYSTGDDFYDLKIGNGIYPQRMPLGSENDIRTVTRKELMRYYARWYVPANATLIVVGNIDTQDMERRIRNTFGKINAKDKAHHQTHPMTYRKGATLMGLQDGDADKSHLEFIVPHKCTVTSNATSTIEKERMSLLMSAINRRLTAQGIHVDVSDAWYLSDVNHFAFSVEGTDKAELRKRATEVLGILGDLARNGFQRNELADCISDKLSRLKADTTGLASSKWCDDFVDYVISGDRYLTSHEDMDAVRQGISLTTSALLQSALSGILKDGDKHLLVAHRNHLGESESFTEDELAQLWSQGLKSNVTPYIYKKRKQEESIKVNIPACISARHSDATDHVTSKQTFSDMAATEYRLDNGLRIVVRPTTDRDSVIQLAFLGRGGLADIDSIAYPLLKDAASYVDMGGLAHVPADSLSEIMQQENLGISIGIDNFWHQVLASGPTGKAQQLFNLVYEKITAPGRAYDDFEEVRASERENFDKETPLERMLRMDTDRMLSHTVDSLVGNIIDGGQAPVTKASIDSLNLDRMCDYYTSLFANPHNATLIITGNCDGDATRKAAINTFARLTTMNITQTKDNACRMVESPFVKGYTNDEQSQTVLNYIFTGNYKPSLKESLTLKLMRDVLQARLLSELREKMNIVYSPYADLYYDGCPQQKYYFWLTIAVRNDNRHRADNALRSIIDDLKSKPVTTGELEKLKMSFLMTKRKQLSDDAPSEWKSLLTTLVRNGETLSDYEHYADCLKSITTEDIKTAFKSYLNSDKMALLYKGKGLQE